MLTFSGKAWILQRMTRRSWRAWGRVGIWALVASLVLSSGCRLFASYDPPPVDAVALDAGALGQACYPNATCNAPLRCLGGRCVVPPPDRGVDGASADHMVRDAISDAAIHHGGATCDARIVAPDGGGLATLAGAPSVGVQDGPLGEARFRAPLGLAQGEDRSLLVADRDNHRIRRVACGEVTTFAGSGIPGYRDGPVMTARFFAPAAVASGSPGVVYVADAGNRRIRSISGGLVRTYAGDGSERSKEGARLKASFKELRALLYDAASATLYVVDRGAGKILTIKGDKVEVLVAGLSAPRGLARGRTSQELFVAETGKHRVVRIDLVTKKIAVVAGSAAQAGAIDGSADVARFASPTGLALTPRGRLLVVDSFNHALRVITWEALDQPPRVSTFLSLSETTAPFIPWDVLILDGVIVISDLGGHRLRVSPF